MKSEAKAQATPGKVDLTVLPSATECRSCGLTYCDCEMCDGSATVQVMALEEVPEKAE